jgi:hypothetical protein
LIATEIGRCTAGFYADGFEQQFGTLVAAFHVPLDCATNTHPRQNKPA